MLANPSNSNSDPLGRHTRSPLHKLSRTASDLAKLVLANKLPGGHVDPAAPRRCSPLPGCPGAAAADPWTLPAIP